ncbi:Protein of unknown function DUF726 [Kalmanozyma brasiliensis GHG001]|uniref:DUF726-domain-containing protein n=1 Tax=Kalmanozyma brasiliensis (strain GHG001) TaxID=1365824 RepID=V5GW79_KALBG|nr:Protein of unknown function DUF726 [Kalmanozyma brasiliensis GHG001]EST10142.1 Protein of unknown function DUF726 [Kalmanozyma brasiliensis GHG001]
MFSKKGRSQQGSSSLDLSSLQSYSPTWSPHLRLATCISIKYAVHRHVERATHLASKSGPFGASTSSISQEWSDYGQKFLTATCQHLGVPENSLPPHPISLEDVLSAAQGRLEHADTRDPICQNEPTYESGSDHARRFPNLDLPIKGVDDAKKGEPTDGLNAEKAAQSSAGGDEEKLGDPSVAFGDLHLSTSPSPHSPHSDVGSEGFHYDQDAQELPDFFHSMSDATSSQTISAELSREKRARIFSQDTLALTTPKRMQGALDRDSGQEIEVAHELLLIALGLGQYRAQDGSSTLFEQDFLFGETQLDLPKTEAHIEQPELAHPPPPLPRRPGQSGEGPQNANATSAPGRGSATDDAMKTVTDTGRMLGDASMSAFTSLKTGTLTGWSKLSSASKELVGSQSQASTPSPSAKSTSKDAKQPVKPNEVCHYDARARSLIFVAVTAMGIAACQIWMAEKVMAQTIFFIMSEGDRASASKNGKGIVEQLPAGASLDARTGSITQASQRSEYMNQHTGSVVQREREKVTWGKWAAMGGGFIAGGLVIGLTGGLAAPLIAPALVGLTGASFLATSGGIIMLGTLFGLGGGGLAGYRVERRLRGIADFSFAELANEARRAGVTIPSLHATICCSGLLLETDQQIAAWSQIFEGARDGRDAFAIECEADMMKEAGQGLRSYMLDNLIRTGGTKAAEEVIKKTALAGIAAITLPMSVFNAASATLDGVFVRAKTKAHKAGLILAETLRNEVQGHRPVILIGISLGAATILTALTELAKDPENTSHLVDSVFLISAPITPSNATLRKVRTIVQRRFVNVFSSKDMVCGIAAWLGSGVSVEELRAGKLPRVAGSRAIDDVPGLENINVSDIISSHFEVNDADKLGAILARCGALDD